jgi:hypothetical protein
MSHADHHASTFATVASYDGYCASCDTERPLVLQTQGAHGFRAWLSGVGLEDRELTYTCRVCGRVEHVPHTEAEDDAYAATLATWPDWMPVAPQPVEVPVEVPAASVEPVAVPQVVRLPEPVAADVFSLAAAQLLTPAPVAVVPPRRPVVRVITLPSARVSPTDHVLAASA